MLWSPRSRRVPSTRNLQSFHFRCLTEMAPKPEAGTPRPHLPSVFSGPALGTQHQIVGGSRVKSYEEVRKEIKDLPDFIPERGYRGYDLELIPGLPNNIVAEFVWPRIREGDYKEQVKSMLNMRFVSQFWCSFVDHTDLMDQVILEKYKKVGRMRFRNAPTRLFVFGRLLEGHFGSTWAEIHALDQ